MIADKSPSITDIFDFDQGSGSFVERVLLKNRLIILLAYLLATIFFGFEAAHVRVNASFEKMIPIHQPFIVNFVRHYDQLQMRGKGKIHS